MTIEIGFWIVPALITIVLLLKGAHLDKLFEAQKSSGMFGGFNPCVHLVGAIIVALVMWVSYFATLYLIAVGY